MSDKWYQNWFNSPYYHILYKDHNDTDARFFIDKLSNKLKPLTDSRMLDIACGRGRHSVYLNSKGYDVTGTDLSEANISYARQYENEKLHFHKHDMRNLHYINYFDYAFNLFTSFGYFDTERDHLKALRAFRKALKPEGILILDYFNSEKVKSNYNPEETKEVDGINFSIHKAVHAGKIIKHISFKAQNHAFKYKEEVCLFSQADFLRMFKMSGFKVCSTFGDYSLRPFDEGNSDRLIFFCQKSS